MSKDNNIAAEKALLISALKARHPKIQEGDATHFVNLFLNYCAELRLNPIHDAYLTLRARWSKSYEKNEKPKFEGWDFVPITHYFVFIERAESHPQWDGFPSMDYCDDRDGNLKAVLCTVTRKDQPTRPVRFKAYLRSDLNADLDRGAAAMDMLRFKLAKTALANGLRWTFDTCRRLYLEEELDEKLGVQEEKYSLTAEAVNANRVAGSDISSHPILTPALRGEIGAYIQRVTEAYASKRGKNPDDVIRELTGKPASSLTLVLGTINSNKALTSEQVDNLRRLRSTLEVLEQTLTNEEGLQKAMGAMAS